MRSKILLFLAVWVFPSAAWAAQDTCVDCHRSETPAAVAQWEGSAHATVLSCDGCHGRDHEAIVRGEAVVSAKTCGACHQQAYREHSHSRHGLGLHAGWGCTRNQPDRDPRECSFCHEEGSTLPVTQVQCARFLTQTSDMGELGCNRCHMVESSCASCHTNHLTDLRAVRDPNVCAKCHMGPDHPQWEMWETSQHGTLYASLGPDVAPDCQRCHMPGGSHDVSRGITLSSAGLSLKPELVQSRREEMVTVCRECHAREFVLRDLGRADRVREQSLALVKQAEALVWEMYDRKLLQPMPDARPMHPLRGAELVTDGQMLYEDISHLERLFFKMKKYDFAKTWKGGYHQNPAYTHWYGNAELKMGLVDIQSEARRLQGRDPEAKMERAEKVLEDELRVLRDRHARGELSDDDYARRKRELLDESFGDSRP